MLHLHLTGIEQSEKRTHMGQPMWLQLNDNTKRQNLSIRSVFCKFYQNLSRNPEVLFIWIYPYFLMEASILASSWRHSLLVNNAKIKKNSFYYILMYFPAVANWVQCINHNIISLRVYYQLISETRCLVLGLNLQPMFFVAGVNRDCS